MNALLLFMDNYGCPFVLFMQSSIEFIYIQAACKQSIFAILNWNIYGVTV